MFLIGDDQRSISSTAAGMPSGSFTSRCLLVGVPHQLFHAAAENVPGGLVAADQDQQGFADDVRVAEPVTVDLAVHEDAGEVVRRILPPLRDGAERELVECQVGVGLRLEFLLGGVAAEGVHQVVGPLQERVAFLGPHAEHVTDDGHGQRRRQIAHEVHFVLVTHGVDERDRRSPGSGRSSLPPAYG